MKEEIKKIVAESFNVAEVLTKLGWHHNGGMRQKLKKMCEKYNIDTTHFDSRHYQRKYDIIVKICPECNKKFETKQGQSREKTCCSRNCSNKHFKHNKKQPLEHRKEERIYRDLCFSFHKEECCLCGWNLSVDVHHVNENHDDNRIENMVPLCANHHRVIHMNEYKEKYQEQVQDYLKSVGLVK